MADAPPQPGLKLPSEHADALAVVRRLREAGHVAYFAGGCVRDMLMGLTPKDYDVATDAEPARVRQLFTRTQAVGAAFGVILVRHGRSQIEVATFRTDLEYTDGRRPEGVRFTTAEEDAQRRDFTINGLFFDPSDEQVIDHVGGRADMESKTLRAIGDPDARFAEDHLRLLRAVRFAARFDLQIEPRTDAAIRRSAPHLVRISPERIAEELRVMLTPPTRGRAWTMLRDYQLDDVVFRFLTVPWPPPHPEIAGHRRDLFFDRVQVGTPIPFGLALAAATLDHLALRLPHLGEWRRLWDEVTVRQMVKAVRQALRVSNDEADTMEGTLYGLEFLLRGEGHTIAALKRFLARPTAGMTRALLGALPAEFVTEVDHDALEHRLQELEQSEVAPVPLVNGDDLTAAGLRPGPLFKRVLDQVYDAQLEDRVTTRDEALSMAMELARQSRGDESRRPAGGR